MKVSKLHTGSTVDCLEDSSYIKDYIKSKINSDLREDKEDPFFICDLGDIVKKWKRFHEILPMVQPFYAVKCNPDPAVTNLLADLGANFDCASKAEIKNILDMGISPDRIIYANPCKQTSHIKFAAAHHVTMMTFDNEMELHKIKQHHPSADLIIRIRVDDSKSLCKFGIKYGACPTQTHQLLEIAKKLQLNVIGVSFHVGSGCYEASLFYEAVKSAKMVFDQGKEIGYDFKLLDVGGGFPGIDGEKITFEDAASELKCGFEEFFADEDIRIIAEPGRYFVASAYTALCNITSVREVVSNASNGFMYYLNDGVYGSFNCILFDHQYPQPYALDMRNETLLHRCSVWGPTCDSMDCITKDVNLPQLNVGDWLCFDNMGAYTVAAASKFNGFKAPEIFYICHQYYWNDVVKEQPMPIKKLCNKLEKVIIPHIACY